MSQEPMASSSADDSDTGPRLERTRSAVRTLKRFDTSPFTLQQHCGSFTAPLRDCLRAAGLESMDPTLLDQQGWNAAPACKPLWEAYSKCGTEFFAATDEATSKCSAQLQAFRKCKPREHGAEKCKDLELALIRCSKSRIQLRMSGEALPS